MFISWYDFWLNPFEEEEEGKTFLIFHLACSLANSLATQMTVLIKCFDQQQKRVRENEYTLVESNQMGCLICECLCECLMVRRSRWLIYIGTVVFSDYLTPFESNWRLSFQKTDKVRIFFFNSNNNNNNNKLLLYVYLIHLGLNWIFI